MLHVSQWSFRSKDISQLGKNDIISILTDLEFNVQKVSCIFCVQGKVWDCCSQIYTNG